MGAGGGRQEGGTRVAGGEGAQATAALARVPEAAHCAAARAHKYTQNGAGHI